MAIACSNLDPLHVEPQLFPRRSSAEACGIQVMSPIDKVKADFYALLLQHSHVCPDSSKEWSQQLRPASPYAIDLVDSYRAVVLDANSCSPEQPAPPGMVCCTQDASVLGFVATRRRAQVLRSLQSWPVLVRLPR